MVYVLKKPAYFLKAVFISQQLQVLLKFEVVLVKEIIKSHLHISQLGQQSVTACKNTTRSSIFSPPYTILQLRPTAYIYLCRRYSIFFTALCISYKCCVFLFPYIKFCTQGPPDQCKTNSIWTPDYLMYIIYIIKPMLNCHFWEFHFQGRSGSGQ